jgi:hypothetical protein
MAARPCAAPNCGGSKNAGIHSRFHAQYHPYLSDKQVGLQPMSAGMREYRKASGYDAEKAAARGTPCQIVSPVCTGIAADLHEPLPRGRAGGLEAAYEIGGGVPACRACNSYCSNEGQVWAAERGLLFRNTVEGRAAAAEAKEARNNVAVKRGADTAGGSGVDRDASGRAGGVVPRVSKQEGRPPPQVQPPPHRRSRLKRD